MPRLPVAAAAIAAVLITTACGPSGQNPTEPSVAADAALARQRAGTATGAGYTRIEGERAGALFQALRPDAWNGGLVLLLHGQIDASEPVQLPPPGHEPRWSQLIDGLLSDGWGVALSSFRANGFAVEEGVTDTRIAENMFTSAFGHPDRVFLVGFSMGNTVAQELVETSSGRYDGFLATCSGIGGASLQWEYFINVRLLFDFYFPDVLPGTAWSRTDLDLATVVAPAAVAAITASPESFGRAVELAGVDQLSLPWTTQQELVLAIVQALLGAGGGTGDFQAKIGGIGIDNTATRYAGSSDDTALNAGIERFAADPNAVRFLERFDPNGALLQGTPVFALHTTRDPVASHSLHFPAFRAELASAGSEHLFATRLIDRFGHCTMTVQETLDAFRGLVAWAKTGTRPEG